MENEKYEFIYQNGNIETEGLLRFDANRTDTLPQLEGDSVVSRIVQGKYVREGLWKEYWQNGVLKCYGQYSGNLRKGIWLFYDERGRLANQVKY
jgi:antitoxin component YwqK of YwqJK toxin-antitoxin module